ncbi:MAG: SRPBCC family protein [Pseudomonadota bacterium]
MNKWVLVALMLIAIAVVAGLLTRKEVRAEIVIRATPDEVWQVITNPASYGDWNPIFVAYEGTFGPDAEMALQMKMG